MLTSTRICKGAILFLLSVLANGFTTTSIGRRAGRQQLATTTSRSSTTSLYGSPSDRARYEKEFEDMMDNDWRAFRAKLVAQEANGGIPVAPSTTHAHHREQQQKQQSSRHVEQHVQQQQAATLNRQSQLGDIFAKSISSIFDGGHHNANQAPMKQAQQQTQQQQPQGGKRRVLYKDANLYSGAESSHIPTHHHHNNNKNHDSSPPSPPPMHQQHFTTPSFIEDKFQDPFVSAAELPLFLRETKINKNRWAHEIPHVEPGCVLIANEKLGGVFHQTVVLIIQHCERSGSIGIVINRPLEGDLFKVATEKKSNLDLSLKLAFSPSPVTYGGPVLPEEYSILHGFGAVEGATKLCPGVFVGGSEDLMNEVRINRMDPRKALFVQGHSAWVPGQLSKEISKGVWYTAAASSNLLLRYAGATVTKDDNAKDLWADILSCMGGRYAEIARQCSGQGDQRMP